MNFKLTLWKSIISLILGILTDLIMVQVVRPLCDCIQGVPCNCPDGIVENAFSFIPIISAIIMILLVYTIWSFIQKK